MGNQNPHSWLLKGTRGQIIRLLRRQPRTVKELAQRLGVTGNAIRAQLSKLGALGLTRRAGHRSATRKPELLYELTTEAEALFPRAYGPLVRQLMDVFGERLEEDELVEALDEVALRLAAQFPRPQRGSTLSDRAISAADVVEQLGGLAEVEATADELLIRGWSCPFGDISPQHAEICHLVAVLLSEVTGLAIEEQCDRFSGAPRCAFAVGST